MLTRRNLLFGAGVAPALFAANNHIGRSRISAITDEIARSPEAAIDFAHKYGLSLLELRDVPAEGKRRHYATLNDDELKAAAKQFKEAGIKISFFNSGLLKTILPGAMPAARRAGDEAAFAKRLERDKAAYDNRVEDLRKVIHAAQMLGVDKVRVFAFLRTAEPEKLLPRIAEEFAPMVKLAEQEGMKLTLENEASCNVGSAAELAAMAKLISSKAFGLNWDPDNGQSIKELPFPDGYKLLPVKRLVNVQMKGRTLLSEFPQKLDWGAILHALEKDGYKGNVGLETHIFGERQIEYSHTSMREIMRLVEPS